MEHELRKHVHNILEEAAARKKPFWRKCGDIIIEMAIIVFAVSFAVFMERQRETHHEQKEVKEFLLGLKTDLENDIAEMKEDKKSYQSQGKWFKYFSNRNELNQDTIKNNEWVLWNLTHLLVNSGRYDGFKASGRINTIKNVELRNNILDLYQELIVGLTNNTAGYNSTKKQFHSLICSKRKNFGKPTDNLNDVLKDDEINNYCLLLQSVNEPIRRYDSAISKSRRIIDLIDLEYKNQ